MSGLPSTGSFDEAAWLARLDEMCRAANRGCGLSYDLFEQRFSGAVDGMLRSVPQAHHARVLELARDRGYVSPEEMAAAEARDALMGNDDFCSHGIEWNSCPVGCGDAEP